MGVPYILYPYILVICFALKKKNFYRFISGLHMNEKVLHFWRDHSLNYLETAFRHNRRKRVPNPDGYGKRTGECGDTVEISLSVKGEHIQSVSFDTNGCINTNACANAVSRFADGRTIDEGWEITPDHVIEFLESLPETNHHCAEPAIGAFDMALANYRELSRNSWMRPYQKG